MNDAALVGLALTNPQQGVAAIYDRYGTSLFNYCYSILRSQADAGDALQESFVTVMGKLNQLRDPDKLRPWLYAIARNQCFKQHRQRTRERPEDPFETGEEQTVMAATSEPAQPAELVALVWEATAGLSDVDRSVLELNIRHELDGEELAESLGVPGPKCSVILHRAKDRLKTAVGALIVSKVGADVCGDLAGIVSGHEFNPLIRKRVARHITGCATCEETERRHRPEAYLSAVPMLIVPDGIRQGVLHAIQTAATSTTTVTTEPAQSDPGDPHPGEPGPGDASSGDANQGHGLDADNGLRHNQQLQPTAQSTGTTSTMAGSDQTVWNEAGFPLLAQPDDTKTMGGVRSKMATVAVGCVIVAAIVLMVLNPFRSETTIVAATGPLAESTAQPAPQFLPTEPALPPTATVAPVAPPPEPDNPAVIEPTSTPTPNAAPVPTSVPQPQPTAAPPPTATSTPAPTPTPTVTSTPPTPTATPVPPTPTATPTPSTTPAPSPPTNQPAPTSGPVLADFSAPTVSAFTVTCGDPFEITVEVNDIIDPNPIADLEATWEDESDPALPLTRLLGNTYRVNVPRSELIGSRIAFFVRGTLTDSSGNTRIVDLTDECIFID